MERLTPQIPFECVKFSDDGAVIPQIRFVRRCEDDAPYANLLKIRHGGRAMAEGRPVLGESELLSRKFREAFSLHEQGKLSEAERVYRAILASDDAHIDSLVHLGMIRLQTGSIEDAVELFRKAVDRDPNSAEAQAGLANALLAQSSLDEAATAYRKALAIDPDHAEAN